MVPHNDVAPSTPRCAAAGGRRALVLAESVYSVLGDDAPLAELAAVCAAHDALLVVDEAHGLGVRGPGLVRELGLAGLPHVVVTATLSKALGSQGGVVLGPQALIDHLVNRARPFIFDTGLAPAAAGAALEALRQLRSPARAVRPRRGAGWPTWPPSSASSPPPVRCCRCRCPRRRPRGRAGRRARAGVPSAASAHRRCPTASPDCGSPSTPGVPDDDWTRAVEVLVAVVKEHA